MIHTEQIDNIKMDIQTVDLSISDKVRQRIRRMIARLQRYTSPINWVDIHLKKEKNHATDNRMITVRVGIPGNDVFASDSGSHWMAVLKNVEEKLKSQLKKRKEKKIVSLQYARYR